MDIDDWDAWRGRDDSRLEGWKAKDEIGDRGLLFPINSASYLSSDKQHNEASILSVPSGLGGPGNSSNRMGAQTPISVSSGAVVLSEQPSLSTYPKSGLGRQPSGDSRRGRSPERPSSRGLGDRSSPSPRVFLSGSPKPDMRVRRGHTLDSRAGTAGSRTDLGSSSGMRPRSGSPLERPKSGEQRAISFEVHIRRNVSANAQSLHPRARAILTNIWKLVTKEGPNSISKVQYLWLHGLVQEVAQAQVSEKLKLDSDQLLQTPRTVGNPEADWALHSLGFPSMDFESFSNAWLQIVRRLEPSLTPEDFVSFSEKVYHLVLLAHPSTAKGNKDAHAFAFAGLSSPGGRQVLQQVDSRPSSRGGESDMKERGGLKNVNEKQKIRVHFGSLTEAAGSETGSFCSPSHLSIEPEPVEAQNEAPFVYPLDDFQQILRQLNARSPSYHLPQHLRRNVYDANGRVRGQANSQKYQWPPLGVKVREDLIPERMVQETKGDPQFLIKPLFKSQTTPELATTKAEEQKKTLGGTFSAGELKEQKESIKELMGPASTQARLKQKRNIEEKARLLRYRQSMPLTNSMLHKDPLKPLPEDQSPQISHSTPTQLSASVSMGESEWVNVPQREPSTSTTQDNEAKAYYQHVRHHQKEDPGFATTPESLEELPSLVSHTASSARESQDMNSGHNLVVALPETRASGQDGFGSSKKDFRRISVDSDPVILNSPNSTARKERPSKKKDLMMANLILKPVLEMKPADKPSDKSSRRVVDDNEMHPLATSKINKSADSSLHLAEPWIEKPIHLAFLSDFGPLVRPPSPGPQKAASPDQIKQAQTEKPRPSVTKGKPKGRRASSEFSELEGYLKGRWTHKGGPQEKSGLMLEGSAPNQTNSAFNARATTPTLASGKLVDHPPTSLEGAKTYPLRGKRESVTDPNATQKSPLEDRLSTRRSSVISMGPTALEHSTMYLKNRYSNMGGARGPTSQIYTVPCSFCIARDSTLWCPECKAAYCVVCFPQIKHHRDTGLKLDKSESEPTLEQKERELARERALERKLERSTRTSKSSTHQWKDTQVEEEDMAVKPQEDCVTEIVITKRSSFMKGELKKGIAKIADNPMVRGEKAENLQSQMQAQQVSFSKHQLSGKLLLQQQKKEQLRQKKKNGVMSIAMMKAMGLIGSNNQNTIVFANTGTHQFSKKSSRVQLNTFIPPVLSASNAGSITYSHGGQEYVGKTVLRHNTASIELDIPEFQMPKDHKQIQNIKGVAVYVNSNFDASLLSKVPGSGQKSRKGMHRSAVVLDHLMKQSVSNSITDFSTSANFDSLQNPVTIAFEANRK